MPITGALGREKAEVAHLDSHAGLHRGRKISWNVNMRI